MSACPRRAGSAVIAARCALVAVLAVVGILLSACGDSDRPPVVRSLAPGEGVTIWQVFYLCDQDQDAVPWGRILVDPKEVEQATDFSEGRLNVVT